MPAITFLALQGIAALPIVSLNDALSQRLHAICQPPSTAGQYYAIGLTTRDDDDEQKHDYAHDDPDPHLHVLPPHLLADSVGATTEALGGLVEVLRFVLQLVDVLPALGYRFEVLFHDIDGVIDLLLIENGISNCTL